jgi:hypothetical protein
LTQFTNGGVAYDRGQKLRFDNVLSAGMLDPWALRSAVRRRY